MIRRRLEGIVHSAWLRDTTRGLAALRSLGVPAAMLTEIVVRIRNAAYDRGLKEVRRSPIPVVSVGNLTVGGSGKTPIAAALAAELLAAGQRPAIVLRGYGMDEVKLHEEMNPSLPVVVGRDRTAAVAEAAAGGAGIAVVDDGFQHRRLNRDLDIVLVSADTFTRYHPSILPAGPYREPLTSLRRADLVLITRKAVSDRHARRVLEALAPFLGDVQTTGVALRQSGLVPLHDSDAPHSPLGSLSGDSVIAVCSIADPRAFREGLERVARDVRMIAFPDHHEFSRRDAARIRSAAAGRQIVTTTKDAVKLRELVPAGEPVWVVHQTVDFDEPEVVRTALLEVADAG